MLTLRAAFRKRLLKHKDKRGSTAHHGRGGGELMQPHGTRRAQSGQYQPHKHRHGVHGHGTAQHARREPSTERVVGDVGPGYDNVTTRPSYAGGHKNVKAAVMKAVRMVAKHKDKRGSTEHHGKGGGDAFPPRSVEHPHAESRHKHDVLPGSEKHRHDWFPGKPGRAVAKHKDKQGSTAHHSSRTGERQPNYEREEIETFIRRTRAEAAKNAEEDRRTL